MATSLTGIIASRPAARTLHAMGPNLHVVARWLLALAGVLALAPGPAASASTDGLRPGEFTWTPDAAPDGPVAVVVSLADQRAHVYRNGVRIGVSTISTGKAGHETPTGIYTILQKRREHYSNLYDNAPMPFMQRLTWSGIALHAGHLPGYPASHGCVRLPAAFAELLFGVTRPGTIVVVADEDTFAPEVVAPGLFSSVRAAPGGRAVAPPVPPEGEWHPADAPTGPMTLLVGLADREVLALRNGVEIGRAPLVVGDVPPIGTRAYVLLEGTRVEPSVVLPDRPALRWLALPAEADAGEEADDALAAAFASGTLAMPRAFAASVYDALVPGSTVVVTDDPLQPRSTPVDVLEEAPAP
jgi:hypothetical protein